MKCELGDAPDAKTTRKKLRALKLAFNAKPDFLIISGRKALMIEAKVESGIGLYGHSGEGQVETQELIADLLMKYVPSFRGIEIVQLTLGKAVPDIPYLTWNEIYKCVDNSEVDDFTRRSLARLAST